MTTHLTPKRERWLLLTLASIQFTSVLDFMIMMPLGPQLTELFDISAGEFGFLVSAYTFSAGLSGLLAATYVDRFGRKRMLLTPCLGLPPWLAASPPLLRGSWWRAWHRDSLAGS